MAVASRLSAIHGDDRAVHIRRVVTCEEADNLGDFVRLSEPTHWMMFGIVVGDFRVVCESTREGRNCQSRANRVGANIETTEINCQVARVVDYCAFGGIVAANRPLDGAVAKEIAKLFAEVVIAPEADATALEILAAKKDLRVLLSSAIPDPGASGLTLRQLSGGYLAQQRDNGRIDRTNLKTVTKRQPNNTELQDLIFAFRVCKHTKSNAIVYVKDRATVGVGAGQMSRVDSSRIAAWKAAATAEAAGEKQSRAMGSVVASDAFFPFADGLIAAAEAGATAVIQPGGSMRDDEVIAAADENNLAMVFTGMRHFRH